jgi:hypothetical protein
MAGRPPAVRIGDHYGRLTVKSRAGTDRYHNASWNCECSCGTLCVRTSLVLRSGDCTSCGCLVSENAVAAGPRRCARLVSPTWPHTCLTCGCHFVGASHAKYCCRECWPSRRNRR